jgi:LPS sulfotransferase NodH
MPFLWPLICHYKIRAVLVTRENVLKTLVSRRAAAASGVYHVSATLPAKTAVPTWQGRSVAIDPTTIISELNAIARQRDEWIGALQNVEYIELVYEDYVQDQLSWNNRVLDFIRVSRRALTSDLQKVNSNELRDVIANYDQVADVLQDSPYSHCLVRGG